MTAEQASGTLQMFLMELGQESPTTRKVLAAVPNDQGSYKPHEKNMSALDLAWHIASSEVWFLDSVANGSFPMDEGKRPESVATPADVVAFYDAQYGPALERVKAMSGEGLAKIVDFFGVIQMPAVAFLQFMIKHTCHHRGQLSVYLRPMGGKVPSIYGGSADEPFQPPS